MKGIKKRVSKQKRRRIKSNGGTIHSNTVTNANTSINTWLYKSGRKTGDNKTAN